MLDKILSSPLNPVTTCRKRSISDVQQGLRFTFALIIFARLLPICLLNSINISTIYTQYSIVHGQIHVTLITTYLLITKIIIVFPDHVFLKNMVLPAFEFITNLFSTNYHEMFFKSSFNMNYKPSTSLTETKYKGVIRKPYYLYSQTDISS